MDTDDPCPRCSSILYLSRERGTYTAILLHLLKCFSCGFITDSVMEENKINPPDVKNGKYTRIDLENRRCECGCGKILPKNKKRKFFDNNCYRSVYRKHGKWNMEERDDLPHL